MDETKTPPILSHKHYDACLPSRPRAYCAKRDARRVCPPPLFPRFAFSTRMATSCGTCVLRDVPTSSRLGLLPHRLYVFRHEGHEYGIVGCAVGAAFAVLIAEELFASGCRFLVSVTSAGQILPVQAPPYFVVIDRALRDEGTSYHYLPPSDYSEAEPLGPACAGGARRGWISVQVGATWTTDAPFRETQEAIDAAVQPVFSPSRWRLRRSTPLEGAADLCFARPCD